MRTVAQPSNSCTYRAKEIKKISIFIFDSKFIFDRLTSVLQRASRANKRLVEVVPLVNWDSFYVFLHSRNGLQQPSLHEPNSNRHKATILSGPRVSQNSK